MEDYDIQLNNLPELKTFRKELRNHLTPAEAKLWDSLKARQLDGRKFRRQHSVGPFILDFYCPAEHLAIELDGQAHASISARDYDRERELFLNHFGILVLRFENKVVFTSVENVLNHIEQYFGWRERSRSCGHLVKQNHPGLRPPLLGKEGSV